MTREQNFEQAFDSGCGSCRGDCCCGKTFYNPDDHWDFEDGELDELEANQNATGVDHAIGFVIFEGRYYLNACDCWHERSKQIMDFIDAHAREISKYLNAEKARKISEANQVESL